MKKGVTVEQVARVTRAFTDAGIMVHAYLMYGFPTQTEQETVDALERVRQLFEAGCIQSAYWHRFSVTAHSPIGRDPEKFGIKLLKEPKVTFARNDLEFEDPTPCDHDRLGAGLRKALYNFMHGMGFDSDVQVLVRQESPADSGSAVILSRRLFQKPHARHRLRDRLFAGVALVVRNLRENQVFLRPVDRVGHPERHGGLVRRSV